MTDIIVGTSKLGWDLKEVRLKKYISVINYQLKNNKDIHISKSYGYSLNHIRRCKYLKKSKSAFYIKAAFNDIDQFLLEIFYVCEMIGKSKKINIQIDEYLDLKNFDKLNKVLPIIRAHFHLKDVYLTVLPHNYKKFLEIKSIKKYNFAIHYSLIENHINDQFFEYCKKNNKKILVLRALGGGINNFSYNDFYRYSEKITTNSNLTNFHKELYKNKISKIEARAYFVLSNEIFYKIVVTTSSIDRLKYLLKIKNSKISKSKTNILKRLSKFYFNTKIKKNVFLVNNNLTEKLHIKIFTEVYFNLKSRKIIKKINLVKLFNLSILNIYYFIYSKLKMKF
tara:strand:- start:202 stop:1215 length:1014 start_codon:yes stop_codon:yes gene_type:complete